MGEVLLGSDLATLIIRGELASRQRGFRGGWGQLKTSGAQILITSSGSTVDCGGTIADPEIRPALKIDDSLSRIAIALTTVLPRSVNQRWVKCAIASSSPDG
ncbi:hypothetical protein [Myxacorys almedinensis]|uniref:Uncharacterized protein n=1 Tax=Myxacorys almedinensis A TaxID=2690445 RepID=A0A8J7YXP5_9CYAN|nr:hypothetical protein [Myxacorys almedinensis]NDJ16454.1 hypothetical protein [Myxacorys almedinensis A]